jgi:hypothetical protein|nr:MAG TPA: hypothetical protein [Caudoviricetes sp.]
MGKCCDTCAYQTSKWKVCTTKRKKAKINQKLLKEKGYCHDYIEKSILFSNFKATRHMYDFFISQALEIMRDSEIEMKEKEKGRAEAWERLKEMYPEKGEVSLLEALAISVRLMVAGWK